MAEARGAASRSVEPARPELDLLWCCARTRLAAATASRIERLLADAIDWHGLLRAGGQHGVLPLLSLHLRRSFCGSVPGPVLALLEDSSRLTAARNQALLRELVQLVELLEANEIPIIPLKGPTLALLAYGDLTLRDFYDLDLLVRAGDIVRVRDLLIDRGYHAEIDLSDEAVAAGLHHLRYHCRFHRASGPEATVEVHWRPMESYYQLRFGDEDLWSRRTRLPVQGASLAVLPPERSLVYLCAHGGKHAWVKLSLLCDVSEMIRRQCRLDWQEVGDYARRVRARRAVSVGLALAAAMLEDAAPQEMRELVAGDGAARRLARRVRQRHLCRLEPAAGLASKRLPGTGLAVGDFLFNVRIKDRLSAQVAMCLDLLFESMVVSWVVRPLPRLLRHRYSLLARMRARSARLAVLWLMAAVAAGYYLLLPLAKLLRRGALRLRRG